jgi:hypothetical protein
MRKMFGILGSSTKLLVPKGKYRFQLLLLVAIGAAIPVTELLVAKLFTDLIVAGNSRPVLEIVISVVLFSLLFASTRIANYLQKTYRVKFFDKAFGADEREKSKYTESWEWAMALEMVNVWSFLTQLLVIAVFFFTLDLNFAAANLLFILIVLQIMGVLFFRQYRKQRDFVHKKRAKEEVRPAERLGSRIQQAELGTLVASFGIVLLFGLLIYFGIAGFISLANTIVLFLGLRLQNTIFSSISSSLMRFARAKAQSF